MKYLICLILLFVLSINICSSIDVVDDEVTCLQQIASKTLDTSFNPTSGIKTNFCQINGNSCYSNGSVSKLTISQVSNTAFSWSDLTCLPALNYFSGKILKNIGTDFLTAINPTITYLDLYDTNLPPTLDMQVSPIYQLTTKGMSTIKLSALNNVRSFGAIDDNDITIDVSGDTSKSVLFNFGCHVNDFPDLSNGLPLLTQLAFGIGSSLNYSSMANIKSWDGKIKSVYFFGNEKEIFFPTEFSLFKNSKLSSISSSSGLTFKFASYIDLSNIQTLDTLSIQTAGENFNVNGNFPFSKFPVKLGSLQISNGNIPNMPNFSVFEGVKNIFLQNLKITGQFPVNTLIGTESLNMNSNSITGTIDKSYCNGIGLTMNKNLLSGPLPDCFYCYLANPTTSARFTQNSFSNFDIVPTCNHSQIIASINRTSDNALILHGTNIGITETNIKSTPSCSLSYSFPGKFKILSCPGNPDKLEVQFVKPNINFTLSTGLTSPIISNIVQTNDTFVITGTYLSYIASEIKVTIGNTPIDCWVIDNPMTTSFYQATCKIQYPIVEYGNKVVKVTVGGLSGTYNINLQYTPVECPVESCGNGYCNDHIGECVCYENWMTVGDDVCTIPNHYVYAYDPLSANGGDFNIYGFYGDVHNGLKISIGDQQCSIKTINSTTIVCVLPDSSSPSWNGNAYSKQLLNVTQNDIKWIGMIYPFYYPTLSCPNDCGNSTSGICNTIIGECTCNTGYFGLDCSPITKDTNDTLPISKSSISNGVLFISNEQTEFQVSFDSISEIDLQGNSVPGKTVTFTNNWILSQSTDINGITKYNQSTENTFTQFELLIREFDETEVVSFATNQFTIESGGIKISFSISNWTFSNSQNTLELRVSSKSTINSNTPIINNCNNQDTLNIIHSSNNEYIENLSFLKVTTLGKVLYGRFTDRLMSNGKVALLESKIVSFDSQTSSSVMSISLPHCTYCLIDPDFNLYVNSNFKTYKSCTPPTPTPTPSSQSSEDNPSTTSKLSISLISTLIILSFVLLF